MRSDTQSQVSPFLPEGTDPTAWLYKKVRVNLGGPVSLQAERHIHYQLKILQQDKKLLLPKTEYATLVPEGNRIY